jgi:hypothetical protein
LAQFVGHRRSGRHWISPFRVVCYLTELFKALPYAQSADDYEALLPWKLNKREADAAT